MPRGLSFRDIAFLGAAGSAGAITPASFPNLGAWWRADSYSLADNTIVGGAGLEWIDQSGNGNDATTGFGTVRYRTAGIGGAFPSLEIGGSNLAIPAIATAGDFTIIVVAETLGDTSWLGNNAANVQVRRRRAGVNNASFFPGSGSEVISDTFATTAGGIVMTTYRRSGTTVTLRENKTSRNSGSNGGAFTVNQIGTSQFVGGIGDLGEIAFYSVNMSDADIDQLFDDYFQAKFSIP